MLKQPFNPPKPATDSSQSLPSSKDAEHGVLSCFLQSPELIGHFKSTHPIECFSRVDSQAVWECLDDLHHHQKKPIDIVLCSQWFGDRNAWTRIGDPSFLAALLDFVPSPIHYGHYCSILIQKLKRRGVIGFSEEIRKAGYDEGLSDEVLEQSVLENASKVVSLFEEPESDKTLAEQVASWDEAWGEKALGKKSSGMPTRWSCVNTHMGGLDSGYTLISGEYSSGKSVLLRNLMVDGCITRKRPGLLVNYETSIKQTISGLVCDIGGVRSEVVFRPDYNKPTGSERNAITKALTIIANSLLKIVHDPYLSAEGIGHRARKIRDRHGDVIVGVDYLQKIPRPKWIEKQANQERELACNSDTLQKIAKEIECPMIVALQLNNDGTARGSKSVNMDGDIHYRIEGDKGVYIEKFKEGARHFHLPIFLEKGMLRFKQENDPFDGPP